MTNQPHYKFPDAHFPLTKGHMDTDLGQIAEYFGPSRSLELKASEGRPIDSTTLANEYSGVNQHITNILHTNFVNGQGWYFNFAPIRQTDMNQTWSVFTMDQHAMEPAPEDTAPRYTTHRREDHMETLTRYNIGTRARHDFFKRPEGKVVMENNMASMISGGWITAKLLVGQAVINSKMHWKEWQHEHGPRYTNVMEAMSDEYNYFGALSKDEKGIYKLHHQVVQMTKDASPDFNMIVLAKGSLNFLALANSYETEVYRRGEKVVEHRLSMGAKSMTGIFPGITIWEDEIFTLQNLGPDEINQFVRIALIGRFTMVDGSDFGEHMDSYPASKVLSIKHASMDIDAYKKLSIYTFIDKCMRWGDDDELTPHMQGLLDNAEALLQRAGIRLHHPDLIDPYAWRDDSYIGNNEVNGLVSANGSIQTNGFHVIRHWGDMDPHYFTVRQNLLFGERAATIVKKEMKDQELTEVRDLKLLIERLYDIEDTLDESIEGFFFAVAANPENKDKASPNSLMLKANRHGCVQPPHVDRKISKVSGVRLSQAARDASDGNVLPGGALFVYDPRNNAKLFVWAFEPESYIEEGGVKILSPNPSDPMFGVHDIKTTWGVTNPVRVTGGAKVGVVGSPAFYILAPIHQFGEITENGEAPQWWRNDDDIAENRSILIRLAEGNNGAAIINGDNIVVGGDIPLGYKSPRLVAAPSVLPGYGLITGAATLAQMFSDGNMRGWDREICETAFKGTRSAYKMARILMRISPSCELLSERYTSSFMLTKDPEMNKINNLLSNLWDHVKYPLWIRATGEINGLSAGSLTGVRTGISGDVDINSMAQVGLDGADLDNLLKAMGFKTIGPQSNAEGLVNQAIPTAQLKSKLSAIINNNNIDGTVFDNLQQPAQYKKLFSSYKGKSGVGKAYTTLLKNLGVELSATEHDEFASAMAHTIYKMTDIDQSTYVFNALLGLAYASVIGGSRTISHTAESIQTIIEKSKGFGNAKRKATNQSGTQSKKIKDARASVEAANDDNIPDNSLYVNSRLAISARAWHNLVTKVEDAGTEETVTIHRIANHIIRPSDPNDINRPLANIVGTKDAQMKESLLTMQHARIGGNSRLTGTIFGSAHLIGRTSLSDELYRPTTSEDVARVESSKYDPYRDKNQHMPQSLITDQNGPLYDSSSSRVDREGHPIAETELIAQKKWLIFRYQQISDLASDDIVRMGALMLCLTKVVKSSLTNWVKEGLPIPDCCYIFAQPWIRLRMSSGLWAQGGEGTAITGYNYDDVVLQFNGMNKTWHMHYTIWLNCAIFDPTKFVIMQDIKHEGYVGGMDDTINDSIEDWDPQNLDWGTVKSGFIFSCGATFDRDLALKVANPLCLYGKYDPRGLPQNFADRNRVFSPDAPLWPSFPFYEYIWNFTAINQMNDVDYSTFAAIRESTYIPGMMPMGTHLTYSETTKDITHKIRGTGHLDPYDPPYKSILNGKVEFLNNMNRQ